MQNMYNIKLKIRLISKELPNQYIFLCKNLPKCNKYRILSLLNWFSILMSFKFFLCVVISSFRCYHLIFINNCALI